MLCLAIDPYPRKPGAVFEPQVVAVDPEDHPFAALKALQTDAEERRREQEAPKGNRDQGEVLSDQLRLPIPA